MVARTRRAVAASALGWAAIAGCAGRKVARIADGGAEVRPARPAAPAASAAPAPAASTAPAPAPPLARPAAPVEAAPSEPPAYLQPIAAPSGRTPPAKRYANLSPSQCRAEIKSRGLELRRAGGPASGIATPLRIAGTLQGVRFVTPGTRSVYGKLDCRLALALDDMARVLRAHGVIEIRVDNMYRPHAHLPRAGKKRRLKPSQHAYGLAADIMSFGLEDGQKLVIGRDWHAAVGTTPCGPEATLLEPGPGAVRLRNLVCALAAEHLFNHILTPSYNEAHHDHVHVDIKRDAREIEIR